MKKYIYLGIVLVVIVVALLVFLPIYNSLSCTVDPEKYCQSKLVNLIEYIKYKSAGDISLSLEHGFASDPLPQIIGEYMIASSTIYTRNDCFDSETGTDTRGFGLRGRICAYRSYASYINPQDHQVVEVTLIRILSGATGYKEMIGKIFKTESLEGYSVGRTADHQLSWFSDNGFDMVVTREGSYTIDNNQKMEVTYNKKATGTNLVTLYFLEKYPPEISAK